MMDDERHDYHDFEDAELFWWTGARRTMADLAVGVIAAFAAVLLMWLFARLLR